MGVYAISRNDDVAVVYIKNPPHVWGTAYETFAAIAEAGVDVNMIIQTASAGAGAVDIIFAIDRAQIQKSPLAVLTAALTGVIVLFLTAILPALLPHTDYAVDYGLWGTLLPVAVYLVPGRVWKLVASAIMLVPLALEWGGNQWFALAALIPLALYSGKRGKYRMKNLFYIYYPAHLVVIWLLDMLL